jgi:NADPH:quinone reductase-like Zn-dependent oxidoreductase
MMNQKSTSGRSADDGATRSATMRAIVQDGYGAPDVLKLEKVPVPIPADDQMLVRVVASSLNIYDWHMTTGTPYMVRAVAGLAKPKHPIPGADVAGVVERVGSGVSRFQPGDEVFGDIGYGAFAEHAAVGEKSIAPKPKSVSFEQAATVSLAGLTALQGLRDIGRVEPGQRVLVNGASGGVGTFAVQIAKALGAEVTAVCSTSKVETVTSIGADHVIDYTKDDYVETEQGYDILFDNVGDRPWSQTSRVLASDGINVTTTGPKHAVLGPMRNLLVRRVASMFGNKRMAWFTAQVRHEDLEFMGGLLASGSVVPVIEATYPLEQVADALRYLGEGHALGKLVITI